MTEERCPKCFSILGTWINDPTLTKNGSKYSFNNNGILEFTEIGKRKYKGFVYFKAIHFTEIQDEINLKEDEIGISRTQFTTIDDNAGGFFLPTKTYIIEIRTAIERLLNAGGLTKEQYFNFDESGVERRTTNHQLDWINSDLSLWDGHIKDFHLEDLRHSFLLVLPWRQFFWDDFTVYVDGSTTKSLPEVLDSIRENFWIFSVTRTGSMGTHGFYFDPYFDVGNKPHGFSPPYDLPYIESYTTEKFLTAFDEFSNQTFEAIITEYNTSVSNSFVKGTETKLRFSSDISFSAEALAGKFKTGIGGSVSQTPPSKLVNWFGIKQTHTGQSFTLVEDRNKFKINPNSKFKLKYLATLQPYSQTNIIDDGANSSPTTVYGRCVISVTYKAKNPVIPHTFSTVNYQISSSSAPVFSSAINIGDANSSGDLIRNAYNDLILKNPEFEKYYNGIYNEEGVELFNVNIRFDNLLTLPTEFQLPNPISLLTYDKSATSIIDIDDIEISAT